MSGHRPWPPPGTTRADVRTRLRADPRVPTVERALLAAQLGLGDDLELLRSTTLADLLALPSSVTLTIWAAHLLERLDAQLAREHPVDLDRSTDSVTVATVLTDDEDRLTAALLDVGVPDAAPSVLVELDDRQLVDLTVDDAESLAYALLRLVVLAREAGPADPPTEEAP